MPRLPRLNLPGVPQHVVQRGNNRQSCFFAAQDYAVFLDKLKEYAEKYRVAVHAYVLMTNHVHLLMTPETATGVSQLMQSMGRYYVRYVNQTYRRTGGLWEGRFKSTLVDAESYLLLVSRYIEMNPVSAGMVKHPADYPWSSYQGNALGKPIALLTPHDVYLRLGAGKEQRQIAYQALFKQRIPEKTVKTIHDATHKAWVLGEKRFQVEVEEKTGRRSCPLQRGGDRRSERWHGSKQNQ